MNAKRIAAQAGGGVGKGARPDSLIAAGAAVRRFAINAAGASLND